MDKNQLISDIEGAINVPDILDDILQAVQDNCGPGDVFTDEQLQTWAENNGYVEVE